MVQSSRLVAAMQAFPVPVLQQKGGLGTGSRLPHFFWTRTSFFISAFWSFSWIVRSPRHEACVPPASAHFSSVFSRVSRYLTPALPIPIWQSFSAVSPRLRWSGSGVEKSRSEQAGELSPRLPPHTPRAFDA